MFERFRVDLVVGVLATGSPEHSDPLLDLGIPGLVQPRYRIYPIVDVIADKVCAIHETHDGRPSTRFRDLVDIVLLARSCQIGSGHMLRAIRSEEHRRRLTPAQRLAVPDAELWQKGYAQAATGVTAQPDRDLTGAMALAHTLLDPVLRGDVVDADWDPQTARWISG